MNALQGFNCHDLDKAKIDCSVIDEGYLYHGTQSILIRWNMKEGKMNISKSS